MNANPPITVTDADAAVSDSFTANTLSASLTATSLPTSLAWYRDVLGFAVVKTFDRAGTVFAASLRAGTVAVLLTQDDGTKGTDRVKGQGISLQLTTSQNIDELASRIKERGGVLDDEPADAWGARVFRLRDPDGFKLVISSVHSNAIFALEHQGSAPSAESNQCDVLP